MLYKINEIIQTVQAEGRLAGTPATLVRFAGCNLACPFCDTDHRPRLTLAKEGLVHTVCLNRPKWVMLTGGEPTMQPLIPLVLDLHDVGKKVMIETNGTRLGPLLAKYADWVCIGLKPGCLIPPNILELANEVKIVVCGEEEIELAEAVAEFLPPEAITLQPVTTAQNTIDKENVELCLKAVTEHNWRLSIQYHKWIGLA